jgi:hypothetical protein
MLLSLPHSPFPNMHNGQSTHEVLEVFKGFLLVFALHMVAGFFIFFVLGHIIGSLLGGYRFILIWFIGAMGFFFWQLIYVIPLAVWLKRRGKTGMMKGVIIGAVLTALVNGACYLAMTPR